MKNLLLTICMAASCSFAGAQTFITSNSATGDTSKVNGPSLLTAYNNVRATGNPVVLKWNVAGYSPNVSEVGTEWALAGICDNVTCYVSGLLPGAVYTTEPYTTSFGVFYALLDPTNAMMGSTAWVRVMAKDTATGGTTRTLTFIGTKHASGVTQVTAGDDIQLFPNPAGSNLIVSLGVKENVRKLVIYGVDGRQVMARQVDDKVITIPLQSIVSGHYYVNLLDASGNIVARRRFVHQ